MERVAEILQKKAPPLLDYFEYAPPHPVHFVLNPRASVANGSAQAFPFPLVHLHTFPPLEYGHLVGASDWIERLVLHELAHIADLDTTGRWVGELRRLFGSLATLLPAFAPRWYREGLAVWAETRFTGGGRLRQDLALWEAHSRILDADFCSTLDCLDEPGAYPYASFPYWMGALFLNELESKRPGLITCLIKVHNAQAPFQLASAYAQCREGADLSADFESFITGKRRHFAEVQKRGLMDSFPSQWKSMRALEFPWGTPILQKGFQVAQGQLLYAADYRESPTGVLANLRTGESKLLDWEVHVDFISPAAETVWPVSVSRRNRASLLRQMAHLNLSSGRLEREFHWPLGADYPLEGQSGFFFFRYLENAWHLYRYTGGREDKLLSLPPLASLEGADISRFRGKEWISFVLQDSAQKKPYQLWSVRGDGSEALILYDSPAPLRLLEQWQNTFWIVRGQSELVQVERTVAKRVRLRPSTHPWSKKIVSMRWDAGDTVFLFKDDPTRAYHLAAGGAQVSAHLAANSRPVTEREVRKALPSRAIETPPKKVPLESYPRLSHLRPRWWFLNYASGPQTSLWGIRTSLQGPMNHHRLNLVANYYTQLERPAVQADYRYLLGQNSDYRRPPVQFFLDLGHKESYTTGGPRSTVNQEQNHFVGLAGNMQMADFRYQFALQLSRQRGHNLLQDYDFFRYQWIHLWPVDAILPGDFWQKLELRQHIYLQRSRSSGGGDGPFWGHVASAKARLRPLHRVYLDGQMAHGKLGKKTLRQGLLSGGGWKSSPFAFYGIGDGEALGNEMATSRLQFQVEALKVYRSYKTFPLHLKDFKWLAGADALKADWIYVSKEQTFLRDKELWGWHWGVRSTATLFYQLPVELDVIFNQLENKYGSDQKQTLFLLNTALSF